MSPLSTSAIPLDPPVVRRGSVWRRFVRNPLGLVGAGLLAIVVVLAVLSPALSPFDPLLTDPANVLAQPGGEHPLGTDAVGRDVLSRLLTGARTTLLAALVCAVVAVGIGLTTGLVGGYVGGWLDAVPGWLASLVMSLPAIIVLLAVRAAVGPSVWVSMAVLGMLLSPGFFRITRAAVRSVRGELYVDAARVSGVGDASIIGRHILSVVRAPVIIQSALTLGLAISIQSGLDFIGLGAPGAATWGSMLNDGFRNIYLSPWLIVWPALAIGVTIGSFVLIGNAVRDAFEDAPAVGARAARAARARAADGRRRVSSAPPARTVTSPHTQREGGEETGGTGTVGDRLLTVERLSIGYPQADGSMKTVVEDVSLHVDRGEVVGVVGESGSGKTQTAFAVLGLLHRTAHILDGSIRFGDTTTVAPGDAEVDRRALAALRRGRVAYVPQEPMSNLDPMYTIGHQLARPLVAAQGLTRRAARERVLGLLDEVGIADPVRMYASYPFEISGGMAQRALIAAALASEPELIVADEPTTALDVTVQADILDLLRELRRRHGMAILLVTHNFGVVADLADRVVVMSEGRVVESGEVRHILRSPAEPYTQRLLGSLLAGKPRLTPIGDGGGRS